LKSGKPVNGKYLENCDEQIDVKNNLMIMLIQSQRDLDWKIAR